MDRKPNPNPGQSPKEVPPPQNPTQAGLPIGRSRGRARGIVLPTDVPPTPGLQSPGRPTTVAHVSQPMDASRAGTNRGREAEGGEERGGVSRWKLTEEHFDVIRPEFDKTKTAGAEGTPCQLVANYFPTRRGASWNLNHYTVEFEPAEDRTFVKKKIMRQYGGKGEGRFGLVFIFDGASLWTNGLIPPHFQEFSSTSNDQPVRIRINFIRELPPEDMMYLHFYNILVRSCLRVLKLTSMGRNFFDHTMAVKIPQHRLELWPGFVTTLREHDQGLLYGVEMTHKVIRTQDVFSVIKTIKQEYERHESMEFIKLKVNAVLLGSIVMTKYNRLTYRVDDINWDLNPTKTFEGKKGPVSFADYYKQKYSVEIQYLRQPLLISNRKKHEVRRGITDPIVLIPELCQLTGLSDEMRSNFSLMKELGIHLFQRPDQKLNTLVDFVRRLRANTEVNTELTNWGIQIGPNPVKVAGRIMNSEEVQFRNPPNSQTPATFPVTQTGDFTMAFRQHMMMVTTVPLRTWVIIVPGRDTQGIDGLLRTMQNVAKPLGFMISNESDRMVMSSTSAQDYTKAIEKAKTKFSKELQMVFVVLPNNKLDLYVAVKRKCYIDLGVSSQCFLSKNVTSKGLMSIATKVVIQMNAKLGGIPWTIHIPVKKAMVIGFDVYHCGAGSNNPSIGAMVATTDDSYGKYYTCVEKFRNKNELSGAVASMVEKCVRMYRKLNNGVLPDRIFIYRDGVGDGQLHYVFHTELDAIRLNLKDLYQQIGEEEPRLSFIVVSKRINTRFFSKNARDTFENPPPGTVVDTAVTIPERWDFFLIAQQARQGVVSPTYYNVIYDRAGLSTDRIQRLAYKLCHMYYNWSGTVAVPCVCQYAHKLAYLAGMATQRSPHENLQNLLYFL